MTNRKLSREEIEQRRVGLRQECRDYAPTRGGYQCQHYAGKGACKRDNYFMCVVWAKRHPDEMYTVTDREKPPAPKEEPKRRGSMKDQSAHQPQPEPQPRPPARKPAAQVYDLSRYGVKKNVDGRHLLEKPELLTEKAVESLSALGIEVTVKTSAGVEVTLVPKITGKQRCELTFEHARTLVMVLQVFPDATVEQIIKPDNEEEAS